MPGSFQIMLDIEEQANEKFNAILKEIQAGKITLEEVKRNRGLL